MTARSVLFAIVFVLAPQIWAQVPNFSVEPAFRYNPFSLSPETSLEVIRLNETGEVTTTSLREESKVTIDEANLSSAWNDLESFNLDIRNRDAVPNGRVNKTLTVYLTPLAYTIEGKEEFGEKHLKIRVRKYYTELTGGGSPEIASLTDGRSFFEFKLKHPSSDRVAVKHRLLVSDSKIADFMERGGSEESILALMKDASDMRIPNRDGTLINPNFEGTIRQMERALLSISQEGKRSSREITKPVEVIDYIRNAYQITLYTRDGKPVDIQITVDRDVRSLESPFLLDLFNGKLLIGGLLKKSSQRAKYPSPMRVVEIKIPLQYSKYKPEHFTREFVESVHGEVDDLQYRRIRNELSSQINMDLPELGHVMDFIDH
ncbi:MAG: hypothetical protein KDD25_10370, partial [Bdellovibrionales bacterium]|nr:hypothetical protein [Bdellovibrionales bacterium]